MQGKAKQKRWLFLVLLVLLALPTVTAQVDVQDSRFMVAGQEIKYVSFQLAQIIDLEVDISADESFSVEGNILSLNPDPNRIFEYSAKPFVCREEDDNTTTLTEYICTAHGVIFVPSLNEKINFTLNITHENGSTTTHELQQQFTFDDTRPQLVEFKTSYCEDSTCYIANKLPTDITVVIEDNKATFYQEKIFFSIDNQQPRRIFNCEGLTCSGTYTVTNCVSGMPLRAEITSAGGILSSDDAGNPLEGQLRTSFICDVYAPGELDLPDVNEGIIVETVVNQEGIYPRPKEGDAITISATISEDASGVAGMLMTNTLTGTNTDQTTSCEVLPGGDSYQCLWDISDVRAGTHEVEIIFTDGVGRVTSHSETIIVDEYIRAEDEDVPQFFDDITATPLARNGFNRVTMALAYENDLYYPLAVTFNMKKLNNVGRVEALQTYIDEQDKYECDVYLGNRKTEVKAVSIFNFDIVDPYNPYTETNRIDMRLLVDPNDVNDSLTLKCNVSVMVRVDDTKVYENPTEFKLTIPLTFINSRLDDSAPGKKYADQIIEFEKNTKAFNKAVGVADSVYATLRDICNTQNFAGSLGRTGVGMQLIGGTLNNLFGGVGGQVAGMVAPAVVETTAEAGFQSYKQGANFKKFSTDTQLDTDLQLGKGDFFSENIPTSLQELFSESCQWATCSVDKVAEGKEDNWYFSGGFNAGEFLGDANLGNYDNGQGIGRDIANDLLADVNLPDPKESIIAAVQARCLPGIIYNLNKYRQMNCQTLTCMKTSARYGTDVAVCDEAKAQFICEQVIGEAFELPGARQATNIMDNTNAWIQNAIPNTLKVLADNTFCKGVVGLDNSFVDQTIADRKVSGAATAKLWACALPEVVGNQMNFAQKNTPSKKLFTYPIEEDACSYAYCNSADPRECGEGPSFIEKWTGIRIPSSTLGIYQSQQGTYGLSGQTVRERYGLGSDTPDVDNAGLQDCYDRISKGLPLCEENRIKDGCESQVDCGPQCAKKCDQANEEEKKDDAGDATDKDEGAQETTPKVEYEIYEGQSQEIDEQIAQTTNKLTQLEQERSGITIKSDRQLLSQLSTKKQEVENALEQKTELRNKRDDPRSQLLLAVYDKDLNKGNIKYELKTGTEKYNADLFNDYVDFLDFLEELSPKLVQWEPKRRGRDFNYLDKNLLAQYAQYVVEHKVADETYNKLVPEQEALESELQSIQEANAKAENLDNQIVATKDKIEELQEKKVQTQAALVCLEEQQLEAEANALLKAEAEAAAIAACPMIEVDDLNMTEEEWIVEYERQNPKIASGEVSPELHAEIERMIAEDEKNLKAVNNEIAKWTDAKTACGSCNPPNACCQQAEAQINELGQLKREITNEINKYRNGDGSYNYNEVRATQRRMLEQKQEEIYRVLDGLTALAMQQGFLNWASLTSYGHNTVLGKISDWSDTWLSSENYKESICSAKFIIPTDETAVAGSALQCRKGLCHAVLSQAAERLPINDTHWLYTATYYVGNVEAPNLIEQLEDDPIEFNIFLASGSTSTKLYNNSWFSAPYQQTVGDTIAFVSGKDYDQICIHFKYAFPPDDQGKKTKYCRDIKDAATRDSDFDTGSPVAADYMEMAQQGMTSSTPGNAKLSANI